MFSFGRRVKPKPDELERLLYDFGVHTDDVSRIKEQGKLRIRDLRELSMDPVLSCAGEIHDALLSIGELESKAVKRRVFRLLSFQKQRRRPRSGSYESVTGSVQSARDSLSGEEEDIEDALALVGCFDGSDSTKMEGEREGEVGDNCIIVSRAHVEEDATTTAIAANEDTDTAGFWGFLGGIFCGTPTVPEMEPPTYSIEEMKEVDAPVEVRVHRGASEGKHSKKTSKVAGKAAAAKAVGVAEIGTITLPEEEESACHIELMSTCRRAGMQMTTTTTTKQGQLATGDMDEVMRTARHDAIRISRLYLGLSHFVDTEARFQWKAFSGNKPGIRRGSVFTAVPPGCVANAQLAIRSEAYVHSHWQRVFDLMTDDSRSSLYDSNINQYKQLRIDRDQRILARHYTYHAVWPTKARDVVMLTTWQTLDDYDGAVLISTTGLPDATVPSSSDCVRATVCSSSCLIRPGYSPHGRNAPVTLPAVQTEGKGEREKVGEGEKDNTWCHVTFLTHCDPGGGVPSWITNMLGPSNSLMCLMAMRDIVEKEEEQAAAAAAAAAAGG
jgi:hypothetical protein